MRNIIKHNDDFNERTNTLLYKNISLTLYSRKVWCWLSVSWRRGQTATYWSKVLLTIAALLSHLGWSCSTMGHWGPKALCLELVLTPLSSYLQLTQTMSWLYFCLTSTLFFFIVIFRTVVLIFIVVSWNTTFRPLYPPASFRCLLFIWP